MWRSSYIPTETSFPPPQCLSPRTTPHTTRHGTLFAQTSSSLRQTMAAAANSIISDPTLPTLPTAWSLIDYAVGYKEMHQLSKMDGY